MADIFETLSRTSALLSSALEQYVDACSAVRNYPQLSFAGVSRAFFDRVAGELPLVISYETKIKQAKTTISKIVNNSPPIPHINSLPPEILIRIFFMVTAPCSLNYRAGANVPLPRYPEYLSHVCTRWRQIALDSPHLWSHIDIVPFIALNQGFEPRAETFVSRAGSSLLSVHIYEPRDCQRYDNQSMLDIIAITAPRTRSLELVAPRIPGPGDRQSPRIIDHCFNYYTPGILTELKLTELGDRLENAFSSHPIDSHDSSNNPLSYIHSLDITVERLDALLLPITHLRLDGLYFPWTHRAYHGLVELRLVSTTSQRRPPPQHKPSPITEQELAGVLTSSPRLRLFQFNIGIQKRLSAKRVTDPIQLRYLEVLNLLPSSDSNDVLRLLAPGSKPLRLSCSHDYLFKLPYPEQNWPTRAKDFFQRSNITQLRVQGIIWSPHTGPEGSLESLPNLRVLALDGCSDKMHECSDNPPPLNMDPHHLEVMYMTECDIRLDKLDRTLKSLRVDLVVFWRCKFIINETSYRDDYEAIKAELGDICSSLRWVEENELSPIGHWD